jgi:hypothetical protein
MSVQYALKHAKFNAFPFYEVANGTSVMHIMLMSSLSRMLLDLEVLGCSVNMRFAGFDRVKLPKVPVLNGLEQLDRYIQKPLYQDKYPVVVWHFDRKRFDDDLCFFKLDDLRKVGKDLLKINYFD